MSENNHVDRVTIYTKPGCNICNSVKQLASNFWRIEDIILKDASDPQIHQEMTERVTAIGEVPKSMPQVFCDDNYIGGGTQAFMRLRKVISKQFVENSED